jgi:hypothetical protein
LGYKRFSSGEIYGGGVAAANQDAYTLILFWTTEPAG